MMSVHRETIFVEDLRIGMSRSMSKRVTLDDIEQFAQISQDHNPVHLDESYARTTMFKGRIAHGMLSAAFISAVIGEQLPGHGTIYLEQSLKFLAPVYPGDVVEARVSVSEIDLPRKRAVLRTQARVGNRVVLQGDAKVLVPSKHDT